MDGRHPPLLIHTLANQGPLQLRTSPGWSQRRLSLDPYWGLKHLCLQSDTAHTRHHLLLLVAVRTKVSPIDWPLLLPPRRSPLQLLCMDSTVRNADELISLRASTPLLAAPQSPI